MVFEAKPPDRSSRWRAWSMLGLLAAAACLAPTGCASVFPTTAANSMKTVETSSDPNARFKAYKALASKNVYESDDQRHRAAVLMLARLEPSKEPQATRALICRTLGEIGDPVARDVMIRMVRDADPLLRSEAYKALGKVGSGSDATVLMGAMAIDADFNCKVAAIDALGDLKNPDPRTLSYLVESLQDDEPEIRYASLQSLRKLTHAEVGSTFQEWRAYIEAKGRAKNDQIAKAAAKTSPRLNKPTTDPAAKTASAESPAAPR